MVLAELGKRINSSLNGYFNASNKLDEKALDALLKEICSALLESDVNVKLVANLRSVPVLSGVDAVSCGIHWMVLCRWRSTDDVANYPPAIDR